MDCVLCGEHEEIIRNEYRKVTYQGKEIEYKHECCYCSTFDEEFELPYMIDKNLNKVRKRKILTMPIKKEWFDMILSGEKKEEYRERKKYWIRRLLHTYITHLKLINGYGRDKPYLIVELDSIGVGYGKEEWGAVPGEEYFILELGKIIERGNINESP